MQLDTGRTQQKIRTRRELLAATRRLLERNEPISVDAVALEASISRTTAYRYFSDADALMLEAMLDGQTVPVREIVGDSTDVRERVQRVRQYLIDIIRGAESAYRMYLSRALASSVHHGKGKPPEVRAGRRLAMYEQALEPTRGQMTETDFRDLVLSLSAASGIESFVALKDVCRVDDALADRIGAAITDAILDRLLILKP